MPKNDTQALQVGDNVLHIFDYQKQMEETEIVDIQWHHPVLSSGRNVEDHDLLLKLDSPELMTIKKDVERERCIDVLSRSSCRDDLPDAVLAKIDEINALLPEALKQRVLNMLLACGAAGSDPQLIAQKYEQRHLNAKR